MSLMTLAAKISLDSTEFKKGLKDAAKDFTNGIGNAAKMGAKALGVVTAAAGAFGLSALKVGGEFDSAMSQVQATLGLTAEDIANNVDGAADKLDALRAKAKEMGASTNFSASQAAEGLNILAMSGYDAEQSMEMIEDVLHLAAAGSMDMGSAAAYVSGTMKGFADETKDAGYYADLMAKGATLANTNVSQLGEAMSAGAAGAAAYNQSADSMTIALLRLAEQGEAGSAAGTALSAAMKNLYTPTAQATKAMKELGVSAYDSNGNYRDFNEVVNELDASLNSIGEDGLPKYTQEQIAAYKQTIFGIQGLDAYNKMTVTGVETQQKWADALAHASDGAGEAAKQYDTMTDNLQGDIDIWNSALDGFKIAVSEKFMPGARNIVQFGSNALSELTEAFESGGIEGAVGKLGEILQSGLEKAVGGLPSLVGVGTQLINALVNGIAGSLPALIQAVPEIGKALYDGVTQMMPTLINTGKDLFDMLLKGVKDEFPQMIPIAMDALLEFSGSVREGAGQLVDAGLELITSLANGIIENLPVFIETVPEIITNFAGVINDNAPKVVATGVEIILHLIGGLIQAIPTLVANIPQIVQAIFSVITAVNWVSLGTTIVSGIKNGIVAFAKNIPGAFSNFVTNAASIVSNFGWGSLGRGIITSIVQGLQGLASSIPSALGQMATKAASSFKSFNWLGVGSAMISGIAQGVGRAGNMLIQAAKNAAKNALDAIKNFLGIHSPSTVFRDEVGKMMAEGMGVGFEDNIPEIDMQAALSDSVKALEVESPVVPATATNQQPVMIEVPLLLSDRGLKEIARASVTYTSEELSRMGTMQSRLEGVI